MHRARQFYLKVHRTSVTCDVMRRRHANIRPRGRGNVEVEVEVEANLCDVSKDVMLSHFGLGWRFCLRLRAVRDRRSGNSHDLLREFMNSIMNNLFMTTPVQPARPFANNCSRKGAGLCSSVCLPVCLPVCSHLAFEGNIAIEPDQRVSSTDIDVESRSQSTKRCLLSRNRNPIFVLFRCQQTGRKCYSALRVMAACHRYLHLSAGGTGPIGQSHHCRWATPKPLLVAQRMATSKA